ncbi:MAG: YifB family Mg chelatase-like AAA ATPase [Gammaproteobacteria bacterium]|nr:MAG: YifB family Mg chelatase-like AAA ATPase [Gammaproteobacteria bacterium]
MQLATLYTRALNGINAAQVTVEVHLSNGLPAFSIVGLPEAAVRESKDRVRAAIINSNFEFPARKITVNLAPADLPKDGGRYDLPIALGILAASGQIDKTSLDKYEFHGELALSGLLREVSGSLPVALAAQQNSKKLIMPIKSAAQAALIESAEIFAADNLLSVCQHLQGLIRLPFAEICSEHGFINTGADMSDVRGQHHTRRALEIAAAGRHNMLMIGPPGTGKSMLASRLPGILPPMTTQQALESASVNSISHQGFDIRQWKKRPFRSPHHTASGVALVGGGSKPSPGEISLAHQGVLFLDELTEFDRHALDVLREPMETGTITISRAARQADFPAQFQLIAAMNPCPQGYTCDGKNLCHCTPQQQTKHRNRISAPFLDRIDIHIEVPRIDKRAFDINTPKGETSEQIRQRVYKAFQYQQKRGPRLNAELTVKEIERFCTLGEKEKLLLDKAMDRLKLSARAYHRILKLARTIADIGDSKGIETPHLTEAISYRSLDRFINN